MKIESIGGLPQLNVPSAGQSPKIEVGDVLKAVVLNITSDEVTLKLSDGSIMPAKTLSALDASIGDTINLAVKDITSGKLILETVKNESLIDVKLDMIKNTLLSLDIPVNQKNIQAAATLITSQQPVNKQNMQNLIETLARFSSLTPEKVSFMISNGLPLSEKNIDTISQYQQGNYVIGKQLENFKDTLFQANNPKLLDEIYKQISEFDFKTFETNKSTIQDKIFMVIKDNLPPNQSNEDVELILNQLKNTLEKAIPTDTIKNLGNNNSKIEQGLISFDTKAFFSSTVKEINNLLSLATESTVNNIDGNQKSEVFNTKNISSSFTSEITKLLEKLTDNKVLHDKTHTDLSTADNIKQKLDKVFKDLFVNIESDTLSEDINVNQSYKDIYTKLEIVKNVLSTLVSDNKSILDSLNNIQDNIKFLNNMSNYNSFIQIPLNIRNNNTTAELYVLKNKKSSKIDPKNASIFLSLDMPHMGNVQVLLNVSGKNIGCNFKTQNYDTSSLIKRFSSKLTEELGKKGYVLSDLTFGVIEEKIDLLNVEHTGRKNTEKERLAFDMRI